MKPTFVLLLFLFIAFSSFSQVSIGPEVQAYPTGVIPGIRFEKVLSQKASFNFRLGYQWIRHRDLGKHEDERGDGYGFSLGYRRFFSESRMGFSLSLRTDIWWNNIDWKDGIGTSSELTGNTDIMVLQPTLLLEDNFSLSEQWIFTPSIGLGFEWNVDTQGEPTGEGAILLIGISIMGQL